MIDHTINWARDKFADLFTIPVQQAKEFLSTPKEFIQRIDKSHTEYG
jgi:hypothetical protein